MAKHMRSAITSARLFALLLTLVPATMAAQVPTATITGRVTDAQDRSIGAVVVTVSSPALQGTQTTTTTPNGDFTLRLLPPGTYTVTFESQGFGVRRQTRYVAATETARLDITLQPAAVTEDVTVDASGASFAHSVEVATNVSQDLLNTLPSSRTMLSAVNLAPSVHQTGPGGEISISGAMSFENLYMVNGVQVQDNIRGEPISLFIEDAIQETTTMTSGISAEYGRFTGGVINTITKSGGNVFSGSFRTSFRNDDWRTVSPFEETKVDKVTPTYEFTAGGPIFQDRTWFFLAGRMEDGEVSRETAITNIPYVRSHSEKRYEFKGTQALAAGQRLQVAYTDIRSKATNADEGGVMDLASLFNPEYPQSLLAAHYTGVLGSNLFVEAQYSARNSSIRSAGGSSRDRIFGTPLSDNQTGAFWFSPQYCAVCGDEQRDNNALLLKGTYFVSTSGAGSHNLTFGYDTFNDMVNVDNHQSGSDYHVWTTASFFDDNGVVYPVIAPGFSTYIIHWPILENSQGTNFRTHSLFVNDNWAFNQHWSFNLGVRFDKNAGRDASNNLVASDSSINPRVAVAWDPTGSGRTSITAGFGRYAAAIANGVAGSASPAGTPAILAYFYDGDPINTGDGPLVSSEDALRQVFAWYDAVQPGPFQATIPGIARRVDGTIKSPYSQDVVFGVSHQLTRRANVRIDVVDRTFGNFYAERIDTTTGQATDEFGQVFDVGVLENTNLLSRDYRALNAQGSYRVGTGFTAGVSYTLSRLKGNFNGETIGSGPVATSALSYPEYRQLDWAYPEGDLSADQRHRSRVWASYQIPGLRRIADVNLGVIHNYESGSPYGAAGSVVVDPFVADPGYAVLPGTMTYYFTDRDAFRTEAMQRTDLALTLSRRLGGAPVAPELFANFQVLNLFDQFQLFNLAGGDINTTAVTATADPNLEFFDPFTETPVEGVHWRKGRRFGDPTGRGAYTLPRTFRFSVGFRF